MAGLSPAEIMLDSLVPAQRLIRRLQAVLKAPVPNMGIDLPRRTKDKIAAFQGDIQSRIDELTTQREKVISLVERIPDQTARTVIELRYGLVGSGCELMPYSDVCETLAYENQTIFRYRKKGVDQLNQLLGSAKDSENHAET